MYLRRELYVLLSAMSLSGVSAFGRELDLFAPAMPLSSVSALLRRCFQARPPSGVIIVHLLNPFRSRVGVVHARHVAFGRERDSMKTRLELA